MRSVSLRIWGIALFGIFGTGILFSEEAKEWIGSYSSHEWEAGEKEESGNTIYYQWQIDSLKKAVSPRYIRLLDIHKYANSGDILNKGILFTFTGIHNTNVALCGNFANYRCIPMRKNRFGIFYTMVNADALDENYELLRKYKYKYQVDGIYIPDPTNDNSETDGMGSEFSLFYLEEIDKNRFVKTEVLEDSTQEEDYLRTVRFKIYLPDKDSVSLVGDFNNWNNESDYLKKQEDGSFVLDMKLLPGTYHYNFIADGETITDIYNPHVKIREPYEEKVSEIIVPNRKEPLEKKY